ncbi:hypothetical protein Tco_0714609 [Tanacetum coccineum]
MPTRTTSKWFLISFQSVALERHSPGHPPNTRNTLLNFDTLPRNVIRANYQAHLMDYDEPPTKALVKQWFPTIGYGGLIEAINTVKKSDGLSYLKRKKSGTTKDTNLSQLPASTLVVTGMHKEVQQATNGQAFLRVTGEGGANPQLSSDMMLQKIPQLKLILENLLLRILYLNNKEAIYDQEFNTSLELTNSDYVTKEIKLEDMSKLVKDVTVDTIELDSLEDDQPFMVEDDEEEEVHVEPHTKTEDALVLPPRPSSKTIKIQEFFNHPFPVWNSSLGYWFDEINRAVIDLKKYVEGLKIEIPGDLKEIPEKLDEFLSTVIGLTKQVQLSKLKSSKEHPQPEGELVKKDKGKKALSHEEADEEMFASDFEIEVRLTGEMKKQKDIKQNIKANVSKAEIKEGKDELIDLLGLEVVERMYKYKVKYEKYCNDMMNRRRKGRTINCDVLLRGKGEWKEVMQELELDFSKPLGEQDPIIKLNNLAKKKRKHVDDFHEYFRPTKKYKSSVQFADH